MSKISVAGNLWFCLMADLAREAAREDPPMARDHIPYQELRGFISASKEFDKIFQVKRNNQDAEMGVSSAAPAEPAAPACSVAAQPPPAQESPNGHGTNSLYT